MAATISPAPNFFILGTGSSTRKAILRDAGYSFEVIKADIDERAIGDRSSGHFDKVKELVINLGRSKADAIMDKIPEALKGNILLTADQVVVSNGRILEKPDNPDEARRFISMTSEFSCSTIGSIVLTDTSSGKQYFDVDIATISFQSIPDTVVDALIEEGDVLHCAGALMIEHPLIQPYIQSLDGTLDAVMGLSIPLLSKLLKEFHDDLRSRS